VKWFKEMLEINSLFPIPTEASYCIRVASVDDGILHRDDTGATRHPDYRRRTIKEAGRLRDSDHTVEDLTERLTEMYVRIRGWNGEFDVESPHQLRRAIAD
jgi:hypothetical protein